MQALTDRQAGGETDRWRDRQVERQTGGETDEQTGGEREKVTSSFDNEGQKYQRHSESTPQEQTDRWRERQVERQTGTFVPEGAAVVFSLVMVLSCHGDVPGTSPSSSSR